VATRMLGFATDEWITQQQNRVKLEAEQYGNTPRKTKITSNFGDGIASGGERWRDGRWSYCPDPDHCQAEETVVRNSKKASVPV